MIGIRVASHFPRRFLYEPILLICNDDFGEGGTLAERATGVCWKRNSENSSFVSGTGIEGLVHVRGGALVSAMQATFCNAPFGGLGRSGINTLCSEKSATLRLL